MIPAGLAYGYRFRRSRSPCFGREPIFTTNKTPFSSSVGQTLEFPDFVMKRYGVPSGASLRAMPW